jgi:phospholipase C
VLAYAHQTGKFVMMPDKSIPGIQNLKHVVVLMTENRSFDHMLGDLKKTNPAIE